jgi:hypothetical protein
MTTSKNGAPADRAASDHRPSPVRRPQDGTDGLDPEPEVVVRLGTDHLRQQLALQEPAGGLRPTIGAVLHQDRSALNAALIRTPTDRSGGVGRSVRALADHQPLPVVANRAAPRLAGPRQLFSPERYEGSDADERRLFYVAMTRARDWLSLSRHERIAKNRRLRIPPRGHRARRRTTAARATRADRLERYGSRAVTLTFSELAPTAPTAPARPA